MNSRRSRVFILPTVLLLLVFGAVYISRGSPSPSTPVQSASEIATQNEIAAAEDAAAAPTTYTDTIPTSEIVSTFSSNLGISINQADALRSVTFPDVSKAVDFWSAPYITILIYPNSNSLKADNSHFQGDYSGLNHDRSWESCLNVIAVFPNNLHAKVDSSINTWCTGSSASPTPSASALVTDPSSANGSESSDGLHSFAVQVTGNGVLAGTGMLNKMGWDDTHYVAIASCVAKYFDDLTAVWLDPSQAAGPYSLMADCAQSTDLTVSCTMDSGGGWNCGSSEQADIYSLAKIYGAMSYFAPSNP